MSRKEKLEQMLERQPEDPFLHYALAMECLKEGNIDAGLEQFDRVLALDPGYLGAYFQRATALTSRGRMSDARATLKAGVEAARKKGDAHAADEMQGFLDTLTDD